MQEGERRCLFAPSLSPSFCKPDVVEAGATDGLEETPLTFAAPKCLRLSKIGSRSLFQQVSLRIGNGLKTLLLVRCERSPQGSRSACHRRRTVSCRCRRLSGAEHRGSGIKLALDDVRIGSSTIAGETASSADRDLRRCGCLRRSQHVELDADLCPLLRNQLERGAGFCGCGSDSYAVRISFLPSLARMPSEPGTYPLHPAAVSPSPDRKQAARTGPCNQLLSKR